MRRTFLPALRLAFCACTAVLATCGTAAAAEESPALTAQPAPKLSTISLPLGYVPDGAAPASLSISPDRKRLAFFRKSADSATWTVVVDGAESGPYEGLGKLSPLWSADSRRVAYVIVRGGRKAVVVDGQESKLYDAVAGLVFSPDSKRFAFMAEPGDDRLIVVDGVEQPLRFDGLGKQGPVFSPDSRRIGYVAKRGGRWMVVVDEKEGKDYDGTGPLVFSGDSRHFAYFAQRGPKMVISMDGIESEEFDSILRESELVFTSPYTLEALAIRNREILRVTLTNLNPSPAAPGL